MKRLIIIFFVIAFFNSCINETARQTPIPVFQTIQTDPYQMIDEGRSLLQEGDIVVRLNRDPFSDVIRNFNRHDKSYSHAGIVLFENEVPYIFHIVNGEENPDEKLKKDSLKGFCSPRKNSAYGLFRFTLNKDEVKRLKAIINKWYAKGIRFDSAFNLRSDDRMYCSEMICKALMKATKSRISFGTTQLTNTEARLFSAYTRLPLSYTSRLSIIAIDDLYTNQDCYLVKRYSFDIVQ